MKQTASVTFHLSRAWSELSCHGLRVPVRGAHITKPVWKALWRGDYEAPELNALTKVMRGDDRLLQLGAGMGVVSGAIAKRYPSSTITCYEANPDLANVITALHERNNISNVTLRSAVVAPLDQGRTRSFRIHRNFTESSLVGDNTGQRTVEVDVHDPVDVMKELRPTVLLCDIEGAEAELIPVLPMEGLRAVVIELHPALVARADMARIFDAFHKARLIPVVELSSATVMAFERINAQ